MSLNTTKPYEKYVAGSKKSGLKVGDRVRVVKQFKSYTRGWNNSWVGPMTQAVGKILTISGEDTEAYGFELEDPNSNSFFGYPYFALKKVRKAAVK